MNLKQLKNDYKNGKITKLDYIQRMHELHKQLFEYSEFIEGTDIKQIKISDKTVIMTSRSSNISLYCDKDDQRIIPIEILNFDSYEKKDFNLIIKLIKKNFTVFDIGGNIGWYAINFAKTNTNVRVHTFEPIPKTFKYLEKNVTLNKITNVTPYNFGFSDSEQDVTFYYSSEGSGNASMANLSGNDIVQRITCHIVKLDDFVQKNNLSVDFIKCDVEGAELFVFQGAIKTINKYKPIIFVELLRKWASKFNYHPNDVIRLLRQEGYLCYIISENGISEFDLMNDQTVETNYLFLHNENHRNEIELFKI